jgi:hypothetical protein
VHVLGHQGENGGLGEYGEAGGRDGTKHGRFFLEAEKRSGTGLDGSHHNFQRGSGRGGKVSLARKDWSQFSQHLGGE